MHAEWGRDNLTVQRMWVWVLLQVLEESVSLSWNQYPVFVLADLSQALWVEFSID
jgi:hypothetical protein